MWRFFIVLPVGLWMSGCSTKPVTQVHPWQLNKQKSGGGQPQRVYVPDKNLLLVTFDHKNSCIERLNTQPVIKLTPQEAALYCGRNPVNTTKLTPYLVRGGCYSYYPDMPNQGFKAFRSSRQTRQVVTSCYTWGHSATWLQLQPLVLWLDFEPSDVVLAPGF